MHGPDPGHVLTESVATALRPPEESRALTGLRALAALLVMLHHFYLRVGLDQHLPLLQWLLRKGYLGVDLFFVLSGFVLSMVYGPWFDGTRRWGMADYLRFVSRRVARLWPLHAAVLLGILVLGLASRQHALTPNLLFANFAMIQAWGLSAALNPPAWSVSTEFFAYLVFPCLAPVLLRSRRGGWLGLLAILCLVVVCIRFAPPLGQGRRGWLDLFANYSPLPLLRCLADFAAGMLAWRLGRLRPVHDLVGLRWFGTAVLGAFVCAMLGRVNDLVIAPLLPLIVLGMHVGHGPMQRFLASRPVHRLGLLSYASYLVHYVLLGVFPFGWARLAVTLPAYLLTTVALAVLLHHLVEQPCRHGIRLGADRLLRFLPGPGPGAVALRPPLQDESP